MVSCVSFPLWVSISSLKEGSGLAEPKPVYISSTTAVPWLNQEEYDLSGGEETGKYENHLAPPPCLCLEADGHRCGSLGVLHLPAEQG